jgi:hypothetical protein
LMVMDVATVDPPAITLQLTALSSAGHDGLFRTVRARASASMLRPIAQGQRDG